MHRTGDARNLSRRNSRWGKHIQVPWRYINYGPDFWDHMRALQAVRDAIQRNEIVHVSIKLLSEGKSDLKVGFGTQKLFIDPKMFRVIGNFDAPILACFPFADTKGNLIIKLHPPEESTADQAPQNFKVLYERYLCDAPQFARMWNRILLPAQD